MEETKAKKTGGKSKGQKYKSLIVWNLLLKHTDETHALGLLLKVDGLSNLDSSFFKSSSERNTFA